MRESGPDRETLDTVVVGAGILGVAIARAIARRGHEVVVLEAERAMGQHASSRNSEVVHAGLYYPPGTLRARLCVRGRHALRAYCEARGVPLRRFGKLVVATEPAHEATLLDIEARALENGVDDVTIIDAAAVRRLEPAVVARAALRSPSTSVVDSHRLLQSLWGDAQDAGAQLALQTPMLGASVRPAGFEVRTPEATVVCRRLVLTAGTATQALAAATDGFPAAAIPPRHLAKGSYFRLDARPFRGLVYPVPDTASLGIHVTLGLDGTVRFGPDQEWTDTIDYAVDPRRAPAFAAAIARYYPALDPDALRPDYAGVRSKVQGPGDPPADFVVQGPEQTGVDGLVALFGIESPGLTACLALAEAVADRLQLRPRP
jgi:L-2-hydroxyglutarate oxidase LhgO